MATAVAAASAPSAPRSEYPYLTRDVFRPVFTQLQALTGREHDDAAAETYYQALARWLSGPAFVAAAEKYILGAKPYFPSPGELLAAAGVQAGDARTLFARLCGRLERGEDPETVLADQPPIVRRAVEKQGGVNDLAEALLLRLEAGRIETGYRQRLFETMNAGSPVERQLAAPSRRRQLSSGPAAVSTLTDESLKRLKAGEGVTP